MDLAGAVDGATYKYRAESADLTQWEIGEGSYNASTGVLARSTVLFNSAGATAKIDFFATPQVAIVALKEDLISIEEANSFTTVQKWLARQNIGAGAAPNVQQTVDTTVRSVSTGNTWTHAGIAVAMVQAVRSVVHDGAKPQEAADLYAELSDGASD